MLFIWYVMFSSHACWLSTRAIISASFARMTACELRGLPKAFRWLTHLSKVRVRGSCGGKSGNPLQALLDDVPLRPDSSSNHDPSLVVEVAKDDEYATIHWTEGILHGNLDVFKGDVRCTGCRGVRGLDRLRLYAVATLHKNCCQPFLEGSWSINISRTVETTNVLPLYCTRQ